jgi:hypothetical protein
VAEENCSVDLNSHVDIFHSIYAQILGAPAAEHAFLCILRHLLKLDSTASNATPMWQLIEKLVCRATAFNKAESSLYTLERYVDEKLKSMLLPSGLAQADVEVVVAKESGVIPVAPPLPPPPPPAPPMPPCFLGSNAANTTRCSLEEEISQSLKSASKTIGGSGSPSSSSSKVESNLPRSPLSSNENGSGLLDGVKLPQQCVPKPHAKMKQLAWSKIHSNRIMGKENLWTKLKEHEQQSSSSNLSERMPILLAEDSSFFAEIEEFFKVSENPRAEAQFKDPNLRETKNWHSSEKINLLDSKRSLNINIYLKQFRW